MKEIAFDESGNSGQNLLDPESPSFALASCSFEQDQVAEMAEIFAQVQAPELKFSKMVGRPRNEQLVLQFLRSPHVNSQTVKVDVTNKRFMIVCKYVDLVLEPSFREGGIDIYKEGCNLATANLLHTICPTFLSEATWDDFLKNFTRLVWKPDISHWAYFITHTESFLHRLEFIQRDVAGFFAQVLLLKGQYKHFIKTLSGDELDPLVPAYTKLANTWGRQLKDRFIILADESKVLAAQSPILLKLSEPDLIPFTAGYNTRTMDLPLKVDQILTVDSKTSKNVQFADLLSGAACCFLRGDLHKAAGTFEQQIKKEFFEKKLIAHVLWPNSEIIPEDLDAKEDDQTRVNLNDYTTRILHDDPSVRL
jgi:hypothetical protein